MLPNLSRLDIGVGLESGSESTRLQTRLRLIEDRLAALESERGTAAKGDPNTLVELNVGPNLRAPDFVTIRNGLVAHTGLRKEQIVKVGSGAKAKVSIFFGVSGGRIAEAPWVYDYQLHVDTQMTEGAYSILVLLHVGRKTDVPPNRLTEAVKATDRDIDLFVNLDTNAAESLRPLHDPSVSETNKQGFGSLKNKFDELGIV